MLFLGKRKKNPTGISVIYVFLPRIRVIASLLSCQPLRIYPFSSLFRLSSNHVWHIGTQSHSAVKLENYEKNSQPWFFEFIFLLGGAASRHMHRKYKWVIPLSREFRLLKIDPKKPAWDFILNWKRSSNIVD